jgi:hypothetical protein
MGGKMIHLIEFIIVFIVGVSVGIAIDNDTEPPEE